MGERVLLVGNGAREHTIAWKLRQSPLVDEIFVVPGNGGTELVATNVPGSPKDIDGLAAAAKRLGIDFYLATMDDPQPLGLVDRLKAEGIRCYGPTADAARIEASKAWAKEFMAQNGIRTARSASFTDHAKALAYVESKPEGPLWVKASGLAAGKGAVGCTNRIEARAAIEEMMVRRVFGDAGNAVVIEEPLAGWETSAQAICDGVTAVLMPSSSDYKRALDGGEGLNTGGMGAYSPSAGLTDELTAIIEREVVEPVMRGMAANGSPYNGTLYPGLMVSEDGVSVVEFNARFGDPETQVVIPRMESDLFAVCAAAADGRLADEPIAWSERTAVGVVMASGGYPASYETGKLITGVEDVDEDVLVFQAGTARVEGKLYTNGGRVLTVVGRGGTVADARERAYDNVRRISFEGAHYRTDIAAEA